jgi:hypothetical protein
MLTKGINSEEQIFDYKKSKEISEQERTELSLKSMLLSCYVYGGLDKDSSNYKQYIEPYEEKLPIDVFNEVYDEQSNYLKGFEVKTNVYTDSEGLNYNSLTPKNVDN